MLQLSTRRKMALANMVRATIAPWMQLRGQDPRRHLCTRNSIRWQLDLAEGIDFSIFLFGGFEIATVERLQRLLKKTSVVVDVGANIGAYALPLATTAARVFALEPTDWAFAKLSENIALNPDIKPRIVPLKMGIMLEGAAAPKSLGASWNLTELGHNQSSFGATEMDASGARFMSLDAFVGEQQLDRLDLVKVDVDGTDLQVLESGRESLKKYKPAIMIEYAPDLLLANQRSSEQFFKFFKDLGYVLDGPFKEPPPHGSANLIFKFA